MNHYHLELKGITKSMKIFNKLHQNHLNQDSYSKKEEGFCLDEPLWILALWFGDLTVT
ncbi:hypothetical protein KIN20_025299 [Parelaphostrongylus tenuis]|uniref:Uncharacterized protein n=1 Tax=Parelaphostrongylus tenuis TaxID=148309 RepID=A0AAD5N948_PARTN|nr:hypothetical protein KIN20_025299 [Parelaphostrongylus tenuis]